MLGWLRDARWLTGRRAAILGLALSVVPALFVVAAVQRVVVPNGPPGPTDFLSFHAASALALAGEPAAAWDPARHAAAQAAIVEAGYFAFFYPPTFLLVCLPLALLPYPAAFLAWLGTTLAASVATLSRYGAGSWPVILVLCIFAPAAVQNIGNGQNAFLTTALFAAAGLTLGPRPLLGGAILATLAFKPQLGLLVLPGLIAARRWRALLGGTIAGVAWIAASITILGPEAWSAFGHAISRADAALRGGEIAPGLLQSTFALLMTLGAPEWLAQGAQVLVAAAVIVVVARLAWRRPGGRPEVAAMAAGAPLVTPFVLAYDLTILLLPVTWLLAEGRRAGFLPWEKAGAAFVVLAPALSIWLWLRFGLSLGPAAPLAALALVVRRAALQPRADGPIAPAREARAPTSAPRDTPAGL